MLANILVLRDSDVKKLIRPLTVINAVEEAFKAHALGQTVMPAKKYLILPQHGGDFRAMPACISNCAGIKWVNVHPKNKEKGIRSVMATIILNNPDTGALWPT